MALALLVAIFTFNINIISNTNAALTTSTVNAAFNKTVIAKRTCGTPPEKYFDILQNDIQPTLRVPKWCNASDPAKAHNPPNLVDEDFNSFWQSTSMVNRANITIDLTGPVHKYYYIDKIEIWFQDFYRPIQMGLYKSDDNGVNYKPWHFYVSTISNKLNDDKPSTQCREKFNRAFAESGKPGSVNDVICMVYSNTTAKRNNDIVTWNPSAYRGEGEEDVNPSTALVDWIKATNIRIEFLTLARPFDPMAVQWYHYAVKEVVIEGYCPCNGHAVACKHSNITNDNKCICQPGTCGEKCNKCCDAYNQYPWKAGGKGPMVVDESAACQLCNCHNHSSVCVYNQTIANMNASMTIDGKYSGGGVCQNCEHNTTGVNCEQCKKFFYHPANVSRKAINTCKPCGCFSDGCINLSTGDGKINLDCVRKTAILRTNNELPVGSCFCKVNVMGRICDMCKPGFYNLRRTNPEGCQECRCDPNGSVNRSNVCEPDVDGQCPCKSNVHGIRCDTCNDTYYGLTHDDPNGCKACLCNCGGAEHNVCNKSDGQCTCLKNIEGRQCTRPNDMAYYPGLHVMSSQEVSKDSPWLSTINIMNGVSSNSGLFFLLLSYQSGSPQTVTVTVTMKNTTTTKSISLATCRQTCMRNLTEFGEVSLSGVVKVNMTFTVGFQGKKVVALPKEFNQPTALRECMAGFLSNCSIMSTDFMKESSSNEECKKDVFSVTAAYFGKALECNCSVVGSHNQTCQKYGGQCHCKPGVTGRQCDKCLPGFYNFTSAGCTACGCATDDKVCNPKSGQCNCPPKTNGRICDKCNATFWGWNSTSGCKSCNCDRIGSTNLQCNLTTGICSCKKGVHLAKCTECQDGYKNFSSAGCTGCECDMRGSLQSVCNKTTGQCTCKANSMSLLCNQCKPGSFHLYQPNPKGCTDCICMGITSNCSSTNKYIYQKSLETNLWNLYDEDTKKSVTIERSVMELNLENTPFITANISVTSQNLIWQANENLTQRSLVSSYAGNLSFAVHVTNLSSAAAAAMPKVIIKGSHNIAIEQSFEPVAVDQVTTRAVFMKETSWVYTGTNTSVSREHFMLVLAKPLAIHVTASLLAGGDGFYKTSLGGIKVSDVQDNATVQGRAVDVEQCNCGPEYTGLSCERCSASHHRVNVSGDAYFGKCQRCNCYKHTVDCHASTGHCYNCDHNTTGNHCERCIDGFYGNATDGTPNDCMTCPCEAPRTTTSLCTDFYGLPKCTNCSVGYEGRLCDKCQLKYFGRPDLDGGNCSLCQCNNNSDICNTISGECTDCKYNTTGFHCERCENQTYGYAPMQNCTGCACNSTGSKNNICDHRNGQCECHPNVDTRDCSKCMENSYNFTSTGCTECNCSKFGSVKLQCNESGICTCKPHSLGKTCNRCETNFYGLPFAECKMCNCSAIGSNTSVPCNGVTGQCHCKPGVTGRQCDRCMVMHYNFSSSGCTPCDECTRVGLRGKLNDTQKEIINSLEKATQVQKLRPFKEELQKVENRITTTENLVKEFEKRIQDLRNGLNLLKNNTLNSSIHDLRAQLSLLSGQADKLKENTTKALHKVQEIKNKTEDALKFVEDVHKMASTINNELKGLQNSAADMFSKANTTLRRSYIDETTKANNELASARHAKDKLAAYARGNVTEHKTRADILNTSIVNNKKSFNDKLVEFDSLSQRNTMIAGLTEDINTLVQQTLVLISQSNQTLADSHDVLVQARSSIDSAWKDIGNGDSSYKDTEKVLTGNAGLTAKLANLNSSISSTQSLIRSTNKSVYINATLHAANLTAEANLRQSELDSVQDNAKRAVAAIKQYESVVKLVNQSLETSVKVNESLQEIMKVLNDFTKTFSAMEKSAEDSLKKSQEVLNSTKQRNTDLAGLQNKVSLANQTFLGVTVVGNQIKHYHNLLLSKTNKLIEWSEPNAAQHSVFKNAIDAESWVELVNRKWGSIYSNGEAVQQEVNRLNASMTSINTQAEHARDLMPKSFLAVSKANALLQNVTVSANQAHAEKNKTADLQLQLTKNMETLKNKLKQAKERLAKIQHALRLQGNTSLQYTPTGRISRKTAFNDVSFDLKADIIQGPLLYLAESVNSANPISISLGLVHGEFIRFSYNLGSGPISITNYMIPVRKGVWYRVYASRLQYTARLTVTNYETNQTRTYESSTNLIMPYKTTNFTSGSPMFVGSLPDGVLINETRRFFSGCIDNVVINQEPLNLWKPAKVVGNRYACSKCLESASIPRFYDFTSGTSFFGNPNTHVIQGMGTFNISGKSQMILQFRTFQENASIVNVEGDNAYIYGVFVELGQVVFYFLNGSDTNSLRSDRNSSYNDGRWYEVHVTRGLVNSSLVITDVVSGENHTTNLQLKSPVTLSAGRRLVFGGKNPTSNFKAPSNKQFAGGLRNLSLSTNSGGMVPRMLNDNSSLEGSSQVDFCGVLQTVEPCIRFRGNSLAAMDTGIRNMTKLSFKFKTLNPSGMLVYGFDTSVNYYFYIALFHGNLYLVATNTPKTAEPSFTKGETLNRGDYHTVTIEVTETRLVVNLDTRSTPIFNVPTSGPIRLNGTLYVGALPSPMNVPFDVPVIEPFVGGMRDIKINDRTQDVFSGTANQVSLAGCTPEINVIPTAKPTIPPPTQPPPTCGDRYPALQLSTANDEIRLGPGNMYIGFDLPREILKYMKTQHVIEISFRSLSPNGVLLYATDSMQSPTQFMAVELVNGRLVFKFNTGSGLVRIQSLFNTYGIGGEWYKATFFRINQFGGLLVSKTKDYNNNNRNGSKPLILNSPLYYGGVPKGMNTTKLEAIDKNGKAISFYGCLGTLVISSQNKTQIKNLNPRKDFNPDDSSKGNASCYKNVGVQASFNGRSYIKLYESYAFSNRLDLTLSFRTYIRTGLLVVWTNKTGNGAITLEQLQGQIVLTLTSATNQTSLRWTDPDIPNNGQYNASYKLCDNKFHQIRLQREGSSVIISVDKHQPKSFTIEDGFYLDGDLYIGGVPDGTGIPSHTGLSKRRLEGCVQSLILNLKYVDLVRDPVHKEQIQPVCRA